MKKSTLTIIIVISVLAIICLWGVSQYNGIVVAEENVESTWGNVESQYQRRADLIPNLVSTVKGYAAHESQVLEGVVAARAKATAITINAENVSPEQLVAYQQAQGELSSALGRLMAISESYPDLKANTNFSQLQAELEGTENRIAVARNAFNDAAQEYNKKIRRFPGSIVASVFGFEKKPYFEAEAGAEKAPVVEF